MDFNGIWIMYIKVRKVQTVREIRLNMCPKAANSDWRNPGLATYLLHYSPGDRCVGAEQNVPHQHGFEERPGNGSSSGVDHVQVHVHAEGS